MDKLSREISKRISTDLGFFPGSKIEAGLFSQDLVLDKKVSVEEDGEQVSYSVYSGSIELKDDKIITVVNLGTNLDPEIFAILFDEYAFHFSWSDEKDSGSFLRKNDKNWQKASLLNKLDLLYVVETVTDQGLLWQKHNKGQEQFKQLVSFISFIDN